MTLSSNLLKTSLNIVKNSKYATQAAAQTLSQPSPLYRQDPKITNLPNGKIIASVENYSPISSVSVLVKAGPRFENDDNLGISHCLRNAAGLSTKNKTVFGITRNIEYVGGRLTASATREHIIYTLDCLRDDLDNTIAFLTEVISKPAFKHWELNDFLPRMKVDIAKFANNPDAVLVESMHKAAFRGGLNNSLFCPDYKLGSHTSEMLHDYVKSCFTADRITVVGVGVDHDKLLGYSQNFEIAHAKGGSTVNSSKFTSGDVRVGMNTPLTHAAVLMEGVSAQKLDDVLSLALLQQVLGNTSLISYSDGSASRFSKISKKYDYNPKISSINFNYSDNGLFGIYVSAENKDINDILKAAVGEVKSAVKTGPSEEELRIAKQKLKAAINFAQDSHSECLEDIAFQADNFKKLIPVAELEKEIDKISVQSITNAASKGMKTKPAIAVVGKTQNVVYADELI